MQFTFDQLAGRDLVTRDGSIGSLEDLYIEETSWDARYVVVKMGSWLSRKKVLVAPESIVVSPDDPIHFQTPLTKDQIRSSPEIDLEKPVSKEMLERLHEHYGWTPYGSVGPPAEIQAQSTQPESRLFGKKEPEAPSIRAEEEGRPPEATSSLRSAREIDGYAVVRGEDTVGDLKDLVVDSKGPNGWRIVSLMVDREAGDDLDVATDRVRSISWQGQRILIDPNDPGSRKRAERETETEVREEIDREFDEAQGKAVRDPSSKREDPAHDPRASGGDVDAAWERSESGDETVGGHAPTPDQDVVEEIGEGTGVRYEPNEPLKPGEKLEERDRKRWELDAASSEGYEERQRKRSREDS
ncbi:MAG: hypothetical protein GF346_03990 [Candidatus Eisenbacteria bacterium]|nr:hypothetical protein [Candidatus Latescibacterota bacterium]MBD3301586.1 hypothetical protein [Candidatus Eisenbacteria bacterium]